MLRVVCVLVTCGKLLPVCVRVCVCVCARVRVCVPCEVHCVCMHVARSIKKNENCVSCPLEKSGLN